MSPLEKAIYGALIGIGTYTVLRLIGRAVLEMEERLHGRSKG